MQENNVLTKNVDFLGKKWIIASIFVVISLFGMFNYLKYGITLGTDFSGGIRLEFTAPTDVETLRELIAGEGISITTLKQSNSDEISFLITAPASLGQDGSGVNLLSPVQQEFGDDKIIVLSSSFVGPSVGADFMIQALQILGIVAFLILVYIGFRFDVIYGIGAIVALFHDMSILFATTIIFRIPMDLTVLAAFLTILGYSINDTIVIFDRVRENYINKQDDLAQVMNKSVSISLVRTMLTSLTTLFIAVAIFIWAGESLRYFGLLLIIGIISGTYSSIFVAAPVTHSLWKKFVQQNKK